MSLDGQMIFHVYQEENPSSILWLPSLSESKACEAENKPRQHFLFLDKWRDIMHVENGE